jgi:tetratricopeptide (TPR) repeat protein
MGKQITQEPVPLMLKKILRDKTQGELVVKDDHFLKILFFHKGNLISAKTNVIEERLGEILFKIGKIDRMQFMELLRFVDSKNDKDKLGKILVQKNILSQRDLFFTLLYQFRTIATSIFSATSGEWDFIARAPNIPEEERFNIALAGIMAEGVNKIVDISPYKKKFCFLIPKIYPLPEYMKEFLSTYEINLLSNLTRFDNMSCEEIIPKMKMAEEVFCRKILLFHLLNIVEFSDIRVDKDVRKNIDRIIGLYEQLRAKKINYYELLGLKNTASFNEIKAAYFDRAKKFHPDRITTTPDPEIKEKANFVFAEMNRAYDILINEDKKREYDIKGYKESTSEDAIKTKLVEKARVLHRKGKVLYSQKKYWEALSSLDEAVKLDNSKAGYFLTLGLCQMNIPTLKRAAEKNLQTAIELENWNVEALTAMGILYLSENQVNRAEGFFKKALSHNPDHALAMKKLQELKEIKGEKPVKKKSGFSIFGKSKK